MVLLLRFQFHLILCRSQSRCYLFIFIYIYHLDIKTVFCVFFSHSVGSFMLLLPPNRSYTHKKLFCVSIYSYTRIERKTIKCKTVIFPYNILTTNEYVYLQDNRRHENSFTHAHRNIYFSPLDA